MIKTTALSSRKALMVQGALAAYLAPRLAADAQIDLGPVLDGITRKNYPGRRAAIATGLAKAAKGKLAQDADLSDVVELLDTLKDVNGGDPEDDDLTVDSDETEVIPVKEKDADPEDTNKPGAQDDDLEEKLKGCGLDEETVAKVMGVLNPQKDPDTPSPATPLDETTAKDEEAEEMMTQGAMDAAIKAAVKKAEKVTIARMNGIREAEALVKPFIGELSVAMDSAESIYQLALEQADVDLTGIPSSAYKAMVKMLPQPGAESAKPRVAMDAAASSAVASRFPNLARIKTA